MKTEVEMSSLEVRVKDEADLKAPGRKLQIKLDGTYGPSIQDGAREVAIQMDWFGQKLAGVVYSEDADEPAVRVEFDNKGRVKKVAVRADLREKIETL